MYKFFIRFFINTTRKQDQQQEQKKKKNKKVELNRLFTAHAHSNAIVHI